MAGTGRFVPDWDVSCPDALPGTSLPGTTFLPGTFLPGTFLPGAGVQPPPGARSASMLSGGSSTFGPYQRPATGITAGGSMCTAGTVAVNLMIPNGRRSGDGPGDCR